MDPTAQLDRVFEEVQAIVDGVTPEQMDEPLPAASGTSGLCSTT